MTRNTYQRVPQDHDDRDLIQEQDEDDVIVEDDLKSLADQSSANDIVIPVSAMQRSQASRYSIPKRYLFAMQAAFGFFNVYGLRVNLSAAIPAMGEELGWDSETRGHVLAAFFYGYVATSLLGGWLANRFGGKWVLGYGILITAVLTVLTPLLARWQVGAVIALRVLEGLAEGVCFPAMHSMLGKWCPPHERGRIALIVYSGSYLGTVVYLMLSGFIIANPNLGWPFVFYFFGLVGCCWFSMWALNAYSSPTQHPSISAEELYLIRGHNSAAEDEQFLDIPWRAILTSVPVWTIIFTQFAMNWGFYTLLTEMPSFFRQRLHFDLGASGGVAAIPYFSLFLSTLIAGRICDYVVERQWLSTRGMRVTSNTISFLAQAIFVVLSGYVDPQNRNEAVLFLSLALVFAGFALSGYEINHLDIAPNYAGILMGLSNCAGAIPGFVAPTVAGYLTNGGLDLVLAWQIVFYLAAGVYILGAVVFALFAQGEEQKWAMRSSREEIEHIPLSNL